MFHKNSIVKINDKPNECSVAEFGKGDISVLLHNFTECTAVSFHNCEPRKIGSSDKSTTPIELLFTFTKVESINVVIRQLNRAKRELIKRNEKKSEV